MTHPILFLNEKMIFTWKFEKFCVVLPEIGSMYPADARVASYQNTLQTSDKTHRVQLE